LQNRLAFVLFAILAPGFITVPDLGSCLLARVGTWRGKASTKARVYAR
jgi:hypothetical protein